MPASYGKWAHNIMRITVVRPSMVYEAETWASNTEQEKKLSVAEIRVFGWMCAAIKMDTMQNERIRVPTKVRDISKNEQERRLKWHQHVTRRDEE